MKYIKNVLIVFLVVMLLTSCAGTSTFEIPIDAALDGGFKYGIFQGFLVWPVGVLINKLTIVLGSAAVAMILTTIIVRMITLPVTLKGQMATKGMSALQPKMQEIEEKYRGRTDEASNQRKAMEMQKLYSSMGTNPLAGMLYPFMSLPIFMAVWRATNYAEVIKTSPPFLGFKLGLSPKEAFATGDYKYVVLMIMVVVTQFIQFRLTNHLTTKRNEKGGQVARKDSQQAMMAKNMNMMMYVFTAMMAFMSFTLTSAMSLYLSVSACISIAQAFYIDKVMREED